MNKRIEWKRVGYVAFHILIAISLITAVTLMVVSVCRGDEVEEQLVDQYTTYDAGYWIGPPPEAWAVEFTPDANYTITRVGVPLYSAGTAPQNQDYYVAVFSMDDNGTCDNSTPYTIMGQWEGEINDLPLSSPHEWVYGAPVHNEQQGNHTIECPVEVVENTKYAITVYPTYGEINWRSDGSGSGQWSYDSDNYPYMDNWTCVAPAIPNFKVYGVNTTAPIFWGHEEPSQEDYWIEGEWNDDEGRYEITRYNEDTQCYETYAWNPDTAEWIFLFEDCGAQAGEINELADLGPKIMDTLEDFGLVGTAGKWVLMFLVMGLAFLLFRKDKTMRVVMSLLVLGVWIAIGWVEMWIIVLLAMSVGLAIFKMIFRRGGASND